LPYRSNKINWNLLLQPYMAGFDTLDRAAENRKARLHNSLQSIGSSIDTKRREKESTRQFNERMDLAEREEDRRQGAFDLQRQDMAEEKARREAINLQNLQELGVVKTPKDAESLFQKHGGVPVVAEAVKNPPRIGPEPVAPASVRPP